MNSRSVWNSYARYFNAEEGIVFPHDLKEMNFYRRMRSLYTGACLEIGAGAGRLARSLLQEGVTVALEPSDSMIGSWNPSDIPLALRVQASGESMPFPREVFQFVCFPYNGLQCVLDPAVRLSLLQESFRVTSPGGVFVLEVSPVFSTRPPEPVAHRYTADLPDGCRLTLREEVDRDPASGNIRYHMLYLTEKDGVLLEEDRILLELASLEPAQLVLDVCAAGFSSTVSWGDYDMSPYDSNLSPRLIILAEKGKKC